MSAQAWAERAEYELRQGKVVGMAEICPVHLLPMGGVNFPGAASCGCEDSPGSYFERHGLGEVRAGFQVTTDGVGTRCD